MDRDMPWAAKMPGFHESGIFCPGPIQRSGCEKRHCNVSPTAPQAATVTLHITQFDGGNAISAFRVQQLQPALEAIHPKITGIAARFVHLVAEKIAAIKGLTPRQVEDATWETGRRFFGIE